jgi:hypothetical protein
VKALKEMGRVRETEREREEVGVEWVVEIPVVVLQAEVVQMA